MPRKDSVIENCGYCRGSGAVGAGSCPACGGAGRHKFRLRRDEELVSCRPCGGDGAIGAGLCSRCGGSGWDVL